MAEASICLPSDKKVDPYKEQIDGRSIAELNARYAELITVRQKWLPAEKAAFRSRQKFVRVLGIVRRHPKIAYAGVSCVTLSLMIWFLSATVLPQSVAFTFTKSQSCTFSPAFFPGLFHAGRSRAFTVSRPASVTVGQLGIFSGSVCVQPLKGPASHARYEVAQVWQLGPIRLYKSVHIATAQYAAAVPAKTIAASSHALPLLRPMQFTLSTQDAVFDFYLTVGDKQAPCSKSGAVLRCELKPLRLAYGTPYRLTLVRMFHGRKVADVMTLSVTTITATAITTASITPGSTVYDVPQSITLTASKKLVSIEGATLTYQANGKTVSIPVTTTMHEATLTVAFKAVLPRQTAFTLHITNVTATDHSQLEQAYDLPFVTSGGPKVTGVNISSSGVSLSSPIIVTFDQPLLASQSPAQLISLTVNSTNQASTYTIRGNTLTITPTVNYPRCALLGVSVANTVQSQYGIGGNSAWQYSSRTICYSNFNIGTSVKGRAITAYQFGSGATMILYIGAMHGSEQNSMKILQKWITALDASPDRIPSNHTIVVIPAINPDGVAANTRVNADGVNLNRNFPSNDWQTVVTEPGGNGVPTNNGGPSPLSEPESQALANYVQSNRPRLVLTYHSNAGLVEANDAGDSDAIGTLYASMSGYRNIPTYAIGNTFDYSTTGAFEDWANQKLGIPALVIELASSTNDEYSRNETAMWAMAKL